MIFQFRYTDPRWTINTTMWKGSVGKRRVGRSKKRWADDITELIGKDRQTIGKDKISGKDWRRSPLEGPYPITVTLTNI